MSKITFITGNQKKAEYLEKYLGFPIEHIKLDLDELQSLDLKEIVEHKVRQAYEKIGKPAIVEDASLEFRALGRLPGTFIRFFLEEMNETTLCSLLDGRDRSAIARAVYGYYDGKTLKLFEGSLEGEISENPRGNGGFGWDRIFIPIGSEKTRAEMNEIEDQQSYLKIKPLEQVREFLLHL